MLLILGFMNVVQAVTRPFRAIRRSITQFLGNTSDLTLARRLGFIGNYSKVSVNKTNALAIPALDRAIKIISQQIASLPFSVYQYDQDGDVKEMRTHPLFKILNFTPSPLYNSFVFREQMIRRLFLEGNVLIDIIKDQMTGRVIELRIIEEAYDKFIMDGAVFYRIGNDPKPRRYDEVIHLYINSKDDHYGRSILDIHSDTLGRALSEIYFSADFYGSGGHVSMVLEGDAPLKLDQREELEEYFEGRYGGIDGKRILAIGGGFKLREMGKKHDATDLEARKQSTIDVANITGVPVSLLGSGENTTYNNAEQDARHLVQYTLRPICERIEAEFNAKLFSSRDLGNKFVQFDLSGLLRGDMLTRVRYYAELFNIRAISPNEIRKMDNVGPGYEGGDEFGMPLASNTKETKQNEEQQISDTENE